MLYTQLKKLNKKPEWSKFFLPRISSFGSNNFREFSPTLPQIRLNSNGSPKNRVTSLGSSIGSLDRRLKSNERPAYKRVNLSQINNFRYSYEIGNGLKSLVTPKD